MSSDFKLYTFLFLFFVYFLAISLYIEYTNSMDVLMRKWRGRVTTNE